jgi:hypothetical protein
MHQHAIFTDVEDMFAVDFAAGERFKFPSRVISELQVFADSQVAGCDELLPVFALERGIAKGALNLLAKVESPPLPSTPIPSVS